MNIVVLGAGAIGCYFGGLLARAGHDVTFIGRQGHVDAINARGLLLEIKGEQSYVAAKAATDASGIDRPDLVLVSVKSADTETAAQSVAGRLGPETAIISLQNGVDNAARFGAVADHAVIPAVVYVGTEMAGPGHVKHHGRGELLIGASSHSDALATAFIAAQIPTTIVPNIDEALWSKLIVNCAYNALSAVGPIAYGPMFEIDGTTEVVGNAVRECVAVANASGVALPADILSKVLALAASMPNQMSSTAQDLLRGKPSEIDYLNGFVVRRGRALGIPTPTNLALQVAVKLAERGQGLG